MSEEPRKIHYVVNKKELNKVLSWSHKQLPCGAKLVLLHLLSYVGKHNYAWPSQKTISKALGVGERQIRNNLTALIDLGIIRKTRQGYKVPQVDGGTYSKSNGYDLSNLTRAIEVDKKPKEISSRSNRKYVSKTTGKEVPTID